MLIRNEEATKRINNPNNLINRLASGLKKPNARSEAMSLFIRPSEVKISFNPFDKPVALPVIPSDKPTTDNLISDADAKIQLANAHDNAIGLLNNSIEMLKLKLDNVDAEKLPGVINAASKVVASIRAERNELQKTNRGQDVHLHFYCPEQKTMDAYEVIEVTG